MYYEDLPLLTDVLIHKVPNNKCWFGIQFGNIELSYQTQMKLENSFKELFDSGFYVSKWLLNNTMIIRLTPGLLLRHALDRIQEKCAKISANWQMLIIKQNVRFKT
jgi:hypothetical protein